MAQKFAAPRGTADVLPADSHRWHYLETTFRKLAERYGYRELRTPAFEATELFVRSSGETSEVVTKQMYTFTDKGGRSMTLKPEGTAPAVRAYLENNLSQSGQITRLWYPTQIFRYERPQKGRMRQAHQVGIELLGSASADADAEVIQLTVDFYRELGLPEVEVKLNSIGREQTRKNYREALLAHIADWLEKQDEDTKERALKNPMRLLDSKDPNIQEAVQQAPQIQDHLEDESRRHFDTLTSLLKAAGVRFQVDPLIVRGLDYYTDTVFEVQSSALGSQSALCGGGRYDKLVEDLGGPAVPAVGVAMGIERALLAMEAAEVQVEAPHPAVFLVSATEAAHDKVRELARDLRTQNVATLYDLDFRGLRNQMKQADRSGANYAVVVGDDELASGKATVKPLRIPGEQESVPFEGLAAHVKR
ncbi:MAG: histidine--tRNA ligase [Fimbriimonadaceae bacterium]